MGLAPELVQADETSRRTNPAFDPEIVESVADSASNSNKASSSSTPLGAHPSASGTGASAWRIGPADSNTPTQEPRRSNTFDSCSSAGPSGSSSSSSHMGSGRASGSAQGGARSQGSSPIRMDYHNGMPPAHRPSVAIGRSGSSEAYSTSRPPPLAREHFGSDAPMSMSFSTSPQPLLTTHSGSWPTSYLEDSGLWGEEWARSSKGEEDEGERGVESRLRGGGGEQLLSVSFNQDNSCFACATSRGFRVLSCQAAPLKESLCRAVPAVCTSSPSGVPDSCPRSSATGDATGHAHASSSHSHPSIPSPTLPGHPQQHHLPTPHSSSLRQHARVPSPQMLLAGGIQIVEMLYRSSIMALVGGPLNPQIPANKVVFWNDDQCRCVGELVFRSDVRGVRLRRDRVVVILEHRVYVYSLVDLRLLSHFDTISASHSGARQGGVVGASIGASAITTMTATASSVGGTGSAGTAGDALCAVSQAPNPFVLACLGLQKGQVRVEHVDEKRTRLILAHESHIAALALTPDGMRLATASARGTLARIFCTATGAMLQELRRGADRAEVYSLAFSPEGDFLALTSDKGTAHVFSVNNSSPPLSPPPSRPSTALPSSRSAGVRGTGASGRLGGNGPCRPGPSSGVLSCSVQAARAAAGASAESLHRTPNWLTHDWAAPQVVDEATPSASTLGGSYASHAEAIGLARDGSANTPTAAEGAAAAPAGGGGGGGGGLGGGAERGAILSQSHSGVLAAAPHQRHRPVQFHSPHHRLHNLNQQQLLQRLRQSQSCPPRRWTADSAGRAGQPADASCHGSGESPAVPPSRSEKLGGVGDEPGCAQEREQRSRRHPQHLCNPGSSLAFMRVVLPRYFSSEWSVAQFRHLPATSKSVVAFGTQKHTLLVATLSGRFYRLRFDPVHGGEMNLEECADIFHLGQTRRDHLGLAPPGSREVCKGLVDHVHAM